jgi:molybdenum cofactor cytidylyltransferase
MMSKPGPKLAGLLLAAGGSERLGTPKQLVRVGGESLVLRTARLLLTQSPTVTVVTGAHAAETGAQLKGLRVRLRRNAGWQSGMGGSLACGMNAIGDGMDGVLIMLCDQWRVSQQDLQTLVEAWKSDPSELVVSRWEDSFGAPAIFPRSLFPGLGNLTGDRGAKSLIAKQASVRFVDCPNAQFDLDTETDLQAAHTQHHSI